MITIPAISHVLCIIWLWHSSYWEMGFMFPPLDSGPLYRNTKSGPMRLLGLRHKRWYIFHLDLLGYLWSPELLEVAMLRGSPSELAWRDAEATWRHARPAPGCVSILPFQPQPQSESSQTPEPELPCEAFPKFLTHGNELISLVLSPWVLGWLTQLWYSYLRSSEEVSHRTMTKTSKRHNKAGFGSVRKRLEAAIRWFSQSERAFAETRLTGLANIQKGACPFSCPRLLVPGPSSRQNLTAKHG